MIDLTPHLAMIALGFIWGMAVQLFFRARETSRLVKKVNCTMEKILELEESKRKLEYAR